jgi:hypothetical protein
MLGAFNKITAYLLTNRAIDVIYVSGIWDACDHKLFRFFDHLNSVLLDFMSPSERELIIKLAIGDIELCNLSDDDKTYLVDVGLLEEDYSWNPCIWLYYAVHGRALHQLKNDEYFQDWVDYYSSLR